MKPAKNIWLNGEIVPYRDALFGFNQALNYGASVYEGIRAYDVDGKASLFRIKEHIERFFYSASALRMSLPFDKEGMLVVIRSVIAANRLTSAYVRPIAFYSEPKMGVNILNGDVGVVILAWAWDSKKEAQPRTLSIISKKRLDPDSVDLKAKISGYYANGLLGYIEAREAGFDLPLFLDKRGFLAEGAVNNLFIVKDIRLMTPKAGYILEGITRDTVLKIAGDCGLEPSEQDILPKELHEADEVFVVGTGIEIQPIKTVQNYFMNEEDDYSVTTRLSEYYKDVAHGRTKKYADWCDLGRGGVTR